MAKRKTPRTRKAIMKRITELGGAHPRGRKPHPEAVRLSKKFNDIIVREQIRKHGICSLNPYSPSNERVLRKMGKLSYVKNKC